jgi:N-acetylglucosaminyldiphosphoundecaprenol N-acetyl-beta-D-mannosaminyltransferase
MFHFGHQPSAAQAGRLPFRRRRRPEERVQLLGATMDLVKSAEVFHFVSEQLKANHKVIVANHNLHSLKLIRDDPEVRAFFDMANLVEVDSAPLLFWARLVGRQSRPFHRCTYLDWRDEFWTDVQTKGWRVFFLGGAPGVGERAIENLRRTWPDIQVACHHGYFDIDTSAPENLAVVAQINAFKPQILLVGMGMPKQELWIKRNYDPLPPCAMFTLGGAFDYEAGVQAPSPRWIGRIGLEWLFRLAMNPRRLYRRYLIEPWPLLGPALQDLWRMIVVRREPRGGTFADKRYGAMRGVPLSPSPRD